MKGFLIIVLIFPLSFLEAQDTIRIMHYNLLNYGNNYGGCNNTNNNAGDKNEYLKTLVGFLQPDMLSVNEISDDTWYHDHLLANVFNTGGISKFKRGNLPNLSNSPIMNQVFYNSLKFTLISNEAVETNYRDIDVIRFFYPAGSNGDSLLLHVAVAHLKAGSSPADAQERAGATFTLMNYLKDHSLDGNFLLSGDLNLYSGSEAAFQNLLLFPDEELRFYDPIAKIGEWHANGFFAGIHTQSAHTSGGCPAGGGMDDRFDFILTSKEILEGSNRVKYIPGSYTAVGQDGLRFNQSLISPVNNAVPPDVLEALYDMSDHLPVVLDLVITHQAGTAPENHESISLAFENPAKGNFSITLSSRQKKETEIQLTDSYGRMIYSLRLVTGMEQTVQIPAEHLPAGLYFFRMKTRDENPVIRKIMHLN